MNKLITDKPVPARTKNADAGGPRAHVHKFKMVVIGASQGGLLALKEVLAALPADFPLPIAVVLHRSTASQPHILSRLLAGSTPLRVVDVAHSTPCKPGCVYLAPPHSHLIVRPYSRIGIMDGRKVHFTKSAVDPLFESAAYALDGHVIAVVLTGGGSDGTAGSLAVSGMGGVVIAQDAATSQAFSMPRNVIESGAADYVLPLSEIPGALVRLARRGDYRR
jgi:two-component system chemotaxis response regulator CheB